MVGPKICIKSFVIGMTSLAVLQAGWLVSNHWLERRAEAQVYTNPAPQGLVPYGESGVFKTGPNGITVIVPEGLRTGAVPPGSDFTPQGLAAEANSSSLAARQNAGQAAVRAEASNLTCNCQCPAVSSSQPSDPSHDRASAGDEGFAGKNQNARTSPGSQNFQDGNAISNANDFAYQSGKKSNQLAGQIPLYGPPTRYQDESGAEATYQQERAQRIQAGRPRADDLNP
ncbi:MAG: hypothetical protein H7222_02905 [Methylotenera sp.]|nr:hypothetical protein [Oligoflexia bacterium]